MKTFSELQAMVHETACSKDWHVTDELDSDGLPTARQMLCWSDLVQDELDECELESVGEYLDGNGKPCGYLVEIVDARIRLMDMASAAKVDIDNIVADYTGPGGELGRIESVRNWWRSQVRKGERAGVQVGLVLYLLCIDRMFADRMHCERPGLSNEFIDSELERITLLKDAYNRTRTARHNGKLA